MSSLTGPWDLGQFHFSGNGVNQALGVKLGGVGDF